MISIFCTRKLAELLPAIPPRRTTEEISPLDQWCVSLTTIRRRKVAVVMCADTRFGFVIMGLRKDHFAKLPELIVTGIRKTFEHFAIRREIIDDYCSGSPSVYIGADRSTVAKLNRMAIDVSRMPFSQRLSDLFPPEYAVAINTMPVGTAHARGCFYPLERMLERLQERYAMKPISRPAFELKATLDLGVFKARRTLLVPADYTFAELHRVLQTAYGWDDYHLYEFVLGRRRIFPDKDLDMGFSDEPAMLAADTVLSDCLDKGDVFVYHYDFGDDWEVSIKVASLKTDFDQPHPVCTRCENSSSPEDVGGVGGFIDFWEAYNDPQHPDHEDVTEWVSPAWNPEPDIRWINIMLRAR